MAIDTAEKRRGALSITGFAGPGVTPDATPGTTWRQEVWRGYPGIASAPPGGVVYSSAPRSSSMRTFRMWTIRR